MNLVAAETYAIRPRLLAASALLLLAGIAPRVALGQGYRKDDIVIGPTGQAIAGAAIAVCTEDGETK